MISFPGFIMRPYFFCLRFLRRGSKRLGRSATLTLGLLFAAFGTVMAQSPESQRENDGKLVAELPLEVLCERIEFGESPFFPGSLAITLNREVTPDEGKDAKAERNYSLSSVTVPAGGWKVDAIAIYTSPSQPADWRKVGRARLNVIAKKEDLPGMADDPRKGREVEVTVREVQEGVYEMRAADLKLTLEPGEYWIGLTPIHSPANGFAEHLIAFGVRDARFDDVHRAAGDDLSPEARAWAAINPTRPGEHLSIRIDGWQIRRGQLLDWPADKTTEVKQLHLRYGTFDPVSQPPEIPNELMTPGGNLWIVQCRQTVDQSVRDQLTQAGATLLWYVPDDAYIVRVAPETVETIRKLESVRWMGPYHPAYRLDPSVVPDPFTRNFSFLDMRSQALEPEGWRYVLVYLYDREEGIKKQVRQVIENAGGKVVFQSPHGFYIAANLPQNQLAAVASCDAVCAIERRFGAFELGASGKSGDSLPPLKKGLITMSQIRELSGAEVVKQAGYEGLGVRVAFWDDGIRDDHVDLLARPMTFIGPKYWLDTGHGTPIASILCGEGRGDARARGLLPLGGLVFATDQGIPVHEDRYGLVDRFVRDHRAVVLSSSSSNWGGGEHIKHYDGYSFLLDDLVLESDLLICTAIGNDPGTSGHCGSWAKNAILVGGVDARGSVRREDHRHGHFTSGPAPDGRVKPDLVDFGRNVYCADATSSHGYGRFGGTSCATPLVAGHCGLMMEMWADGVFGDLPLGRTVFDRKPHAATAKALMINSAYRYSVDGDNPEFTRFKQGWGMPNLGRLYESRKKLFVVNQEMALRDHQAVEYQLRIPEGEPELRVTLAYTDPLCTTATAKALVNDLDLIVIAPDGNRYYGNHGLLDGNFSRAGGVSDRLNNVENVFLHEPAPGVWQVIVAAHRIACDGHQRTTTWDQDYALVVAGVEPDWAPPKPVAK
jgi:serine protease AprX